MYFRGAVFGPGGGFAAILPNLHGQRGGVEPERHGAVFAGVWRSPAVGAGAVALAGRARQLRSPPEAWRELRTAACRTCGGHPRSLRAVDHGGEAGYAARDLSGFAAGGLDFSDAGFRPR